MKPYHCPVCDKRMRVCFHGVDDGHRMREVSHPTKRFARINSRAPRKEDGTRNVGEYREDKIRVGHKLIKYFPDSKAKRDSFRIELMCGRQLPGKVVGGCGLVVEARGRSGQLVRCAVRNKFRHTSRKQRARK